jgi:hypothetical protein
MARRPRYDDAGRWVDRFGLLLVLTIATIVMLALVDVTDTSDGVVSVLVWVVSTVLVGATLLLSLRAAGLSRHRQRFIDVLVVLALGTVIALVVRQALDPTVPTDPTAATPPGMVVALAAVAPVAVAGRLLRHREVTNATLLGAIAAYLLIPLAFFELFVALDTWTGEPFFGQPEPSPAYMYFSLTTVTTVGYGDLTPVSDLARLAANAEAVIGQVYLVTFVAMIVGLRAQQWGNRHRADESATDTLGPGPVTDSRDDA